MLHLGTTLYEQAIWTGFYFFCYEHTGLTRVEVQAIQKYDVLDFRNLLSPPLFGNCEKKAGSSKSTHYF